MAKRATRGRAFQYAVFGRTQISVQQKNSTKAIVLRKPLEIELQTSRKLLGNQKTASQALILNFVVELQYVQSQAK